jgi:Fur family ferric uptake transcriptional regulator
MIAKKNNFQFEDLLAKHHLKKTEGRMRVLAMLSSKTFATSQPDLEEVMLDVDRGTLYRILSVFEEKGIIHKVFDLNGTANYALCHSSCQENHHHDEHLHFNCIMCNNVYCLDDLDLPNLHLPSGFQSQTFSLSATGICPKCNKKPVHPETEE